MSGMTFNQAVLVFEEMAASNKGLDYACKKYGFRKEDITKMIVQRKDISDLYFQYKKRQAAMITEAIEENARDIETYYDSRIGTIRAEPSLIALANLRVTTYKWILERIKPELFDLKRDSSEPTFEISEESMRQLDILREAYKLEY